MALRFGALFAGYGGLELGVQSVLGGSTAWVAENAPGPAAVLAARFPTAPNLGDVRAVDWSAVEPVDVLTGGFPCQDVSHAGRGRGLRPGTRSGLWSHMAYAIDRLRPGLVVIENVRGLRSADATSNVELCPWCMGAGRARVLRALGAVLGDLADCGYDARWLSVRASDAGAPHERQRLFLFAARSAAADTEPVSHAEHRDAGRVASAPGRGTGADGHDAWARAVDGAAERGRGRAGRAGRDGPASLAWGPYAAAVERWERLTRPAPYPVEAAPDGSRRISARFAEWMMGLPDGWVTDVAGVSRPAVLAMLGNGVVPQQAALAAALWRNENAAPPGKGEAA